MTQERYFAADADADKERHRLNELERQLDPMARRVFESSGIRAGQHILEIGPGAGSMLRWCASRVGPEGHVTGLDLDPRFLDATAPANVTVLRGDVMEAADAPGPFDIVYARYVVMHLPDTARALRLVLGRLRPGGTLILIEPDFLTLRAAAPDHPDADAFDREMGRRTKLLRDYGVMELNFARRLPAALEAAGFVDVDGQGTVSVERGGSPNARFWRASAETSNAAMQNLAADNAPADVLLRCYLDPTFWFCSPIQMAVTGRAPLS